MMTMVLADRRALSPSPSRSKDFTVAILSPGLQVNANLTEKIEPRRQTKFLVLTKDRRLKSAFRHIQTAMRMQYTEPTWPRHDSKSCRPTRPRSRSSRHGSCAEHRSADRPSVSSTHTMVGGISSVSGMGFLVYGSLPGVSNLPRHMCASKRALVSNHPMRLHIIMGITNSDI